MNMDFPVRFWQKLQILFSRIPEELDESGEVSGSGTDTPGEEGPCMEVFFWSRAAFRLEEDHGYDEKTAYERIEHRICTGRRFRIRVAAAAAAVLLLAGVGISLFVIDEEKELPLAGTFDLPQTVEIRRPVLELANGEKLVVESGLHEKECRNLGIRLTNDQVRNTLDYESMDTTVSSKAGSNVLRVPKGQTYSILLPDHTRVWLNSQSSLSFPVAFSGPTREVFLEGQAFFEVAKNQDRPFLVQTADRTVRVTGTSFDISAYPGDPFWHTVLVSGKVEILDGNDLIPLSPSQRYRVDETGTGIVDEVCTDRFTSWIRGKICFENSSFDEIRRILERWYDFEITTRDKKIMKKRFTGVIYKHLPVDVTLSCLEKTTNIRFVVNGRNITAIMK